MVVMAVSLSDRSSNSSDTDTDDGDSSILSSELSDCDSVSGLPEGTEVLPYQFEPEASPDGDGDSCDMDAPTKAPAAVDSSVDRIGNVDW